MTFLPMNSECEAAMDTNLRILTSSRVLILVFALLLAGTSAGTTLPGYLLSLAVYRPATSHIYAYTDLTVKAFALNGGYGAPGDIPVVGDFDGNGVYDLAVFRNGSWFINTNHSLTVDQTIGFGGVPGDIPLAGDFDGDGIADLVIYRAGRWFIRGSEPGNAVTQRSFGGATDVPVIADFDGDGIPDLAVYRSGTWLIQISTTGATVVDHFGGLPNDRPCAVDWDHDGKAKLCIYRDGIWYFKSVGATTLLDSYAFGGPGDLPLPGGAFDYSGAIYVKAGASGTQNGTPAHPFATIVQGVNAAVGGSVVRIAGGSYPENVTLNGPTHSGGKNNLKLLGVGARAVSWVPANNDAFLLQGSTGNVLESVSMSATNGRAVVLVGGPGSYLPSDPGSTLSLAFTTISETLSQGVLIVGSSHADISHNQINRSKTMSGIGIQQGTPSAPASANIMYNELAHNGYTIVQNPTSPNPNGNGIEAQHSSSLSVVGNYIHDNQSQGIVAINDSHLTISANTISGNQLDGIFFCTSGGNDTSTGQIDGNWIAGNGAAGGQGFNGLELFITCVDTNFVVNSNTFDSNTADGVFVGSGAASVTNNVFNHNENGVVLYVDSSSLANTALTVFGNSFANSVNTDIFAQINGGAKGITATVGGTLPGQANNFVGNGIEFHNISCTTTAINITCPTGGNTFSGSTAGAKIEGTCASTCVQ